MSRSRDNHKIAELLLTVPERAERFYASERRRIEREFYESPGIPVKGGRKYSDRLRERFAQKRAKGD